MTAGLVKLSDYVAQFLARKQIRHAFAVAGGASLHLIHSIDATHGIDFVCPQHEQGGVMAADAYSRVTGNLGVAIATSGPGATNMLTGTCGAFYDSVPLLLITGQVSTFRMKGNLRVRQVGFQETDTVEIYRPITKHAVMVTEPEQISYELEKACFIATTGRPGPVLVDIPDNVQRAMIDVDTLPHFQFSEEKLEPTPSDIDDCLQLIENAQRPVVIFGWGVHLAKAEAEALTFAESLGLPVAPTWAAADMIPHNHPLLIGTFGTHGTRFANLAVQNADLIFSVGSRLDTKATGSPASTFARGATKVMVDIDFGELDKFSQNGLEIDLPIRAHARCFLKAMNSATESRPVCSLSSWLSTIADWKRKHAICPPGYYEDSDVNPYVFVKELSRVSDEADTIVVDTGCALAWMMQAFEFKRGQRLFHDFNNTAMGWALPASIGTSLANHRCPVLCVVGDGSLQMSIQELATIIRHKLPIKIFLINNHGYSMIQQTQEQWLDSKYLASSVAGGLPMLDFVEIARAYGFQTSTIRSNSDIGPELTTAMQDDGPFFCNVEIPAHHRVVPQVKFGRPNEDPEPLVCRAEFLSDMIVQPLDVSLSPTA